MELQIEDKRNEFLKSSSMSVKNKIKLSYVAYLTLTELKDIFKKIFDSMPFKKTQEKIETMKFELNNNAEIELNASYKKERGHEFVGKKTLAKLSDFDTYVYADLNENLVENQRMKNEIKIDFISKMMKKFVDYASKARTYLCTKPNTEINKRIIKMLDDYIYKYDLSRPLGI